MTTKEAYEFLLSRGYNVIPPDINDRWMECVRTDTNRFTVEQVEDMKYLENNAGIAQG